MLKPISKVKEMFANRMLVNVPDLIRINLEVGDKINVGINFLYEASPATEAIAAVDEIPEKKDKEGKILQAYKPGVRAFPAREATYNGGEHPVSYHITPDLTGKDKEQFTLRKAHDLVIESLKSEVRSGFEVKFDIVNMKSA